MLLASAAAALVLHTTPNRDLNDALAGAARTLGIKLAAPADVAAWLPLAELREHVHAFTSLPAAHALSASEHRELLQNVVAVLRDTRVQGEGQGQGEGQDEGQGQGEAEEDRGYRLEMLRSAVRVRLEQILLLLDAPRPPAHASLLRFPPDLDSLRLVAHQAQDAIARVASAHRRWPQQHARHGHSGSSTNAVAPEPDALLLQQEREEGQRRLRACKTEARAAAEARDAAQRNVDSVSRELQDMLGRLAAAQHELQAAEAAKASLESSLHASSSISDDLRLQLAQLREKQASVAHMQNATKEVQLQLAEILQEASQSRLGLLDYEERLNSSQAKRARLEEELRVVEAQAQAHARAAAEQGGRAEAAEERLGICQGSLQGCAASLEAALATSSGALGDALSATQQLRACEEEGQGAAQGCKLALLAAESSLESCSSTLRACGEDAAACRESVAACAARSQGAQDEGRAALAACRADVLSLEMQGEQTCAARGEELLLLGGRVRALDEQAAAHRAAEAALRTGLEAAEARAGACVAEAEAAKAAKAEAAKAEAAKAEAAKAEAAKAEAEAAKAPAEHGREICAPIAAALAECESALTSSRTCGGEAGEEGERGDLLKRLHECVLGKKGLEFLRGEDEARHAHVRGQLEFCQV